MCGLVALLPLMKLAIMAFALMVLLPSVLNVQGQNISARLGEQVELGIGEQVEIEPEGLLVSFVQVVQDSRCPSDALCIWEGQATVSIGVQLDGRNYQEMMLTIGADESPTSVYGRHSVTLINLEPHPQSSIQTDPGDYIVTLVISQAAVNSAGVFVRAASEDSAVIAGWNLNLGRGTLVLLSRGDIGTTMSVIRFVPAAAQCTTSDANECINGQVIEATGMLSGSTVIHLEVSGGKLITTSEGAHSLDIKRIRATGPASPT